jgi:hypothetical protein
VRNSHRKGGKDTEGRGWEREQEQRPKTLRGRKTETDAEETVQTPRERPEKGTDTEGC